MRTLVVTSTRTYAGKTTIGLGVALNSKMKCGYLKPLGDRPVYEKKKLIDQDTEVYAEWLGLETPPEDCCIGFEHEKMQSFSGKMEADTTLRERLAAVSKGKDIMIVETGRNYSFGGSIGFDAGTLARKLNGKILLVAQGDTHIIIDKVLAASKSFKSSGARLVGVLINKMKEDEKSQVDEQILPVLAQENIPYLGSVPYEQSLEKFKTSLVIDKLNAKLVAGEGGVDKSVESVLVGALSADAAMRMPSFHQKNKMIITGGDRSDLVIVSLSEDTSGIILTNNILPHPRILSQADQYNVPVLSVPMDTYTTAKMVEQIIAEIKPGDNDKRTTIEKLVGQSVSVDKILE